MNVAATHDQPESPMMERLRAWQEKATARFGLDSRPTIRKVVIAVIGFTVLLIGIIMIALPGPAVIVIPVGLAILATEFAWARRILRRGSVFVARVRERWKK